MEHCRVVQLVGVFCILSVGEEHMLIACGVSFELVILISFVSDISKEPVGDFEWCFHQDLWIVGLFPLVPLKQRGVGEMLRQETAACKGIWKSNTPTLQGSYFALDNLASCIPRAFELALLSNRVADRVVTIKLGWEFGCGIVFLSAFVLSWPAICPVCKRILEVTRPGTKRYLFGMTHTY